MILCGDARHISGNADRGPQAAGRRARPARARLRDRWARRRATPESRHGAEGAGLSGENRGGRTRTCNPRFWRPVLCQLSYAPRFAAVIVHGSTILRCGAACSGARSAPLPRDRARDGRDRRRLGPPRALGDRDRRRGARGVDGDPRRPRPALRARNIARRSVLSHRERRGHQGSLAGVPAHPRREAARPADPHVRAARQVRGRTPRQRPARARRRGRPRLVRPARPDRRDRALRPRPRREVRDLRDRPHQGLDHRRAARARLGAALGPGPRPRHRARDRRARVEARPRAERRRDRRASSASPRTSSRTA